MRLIFDKKDRFLRPIFEVKNLFRFRKFFVHNRVGGKEEDLPKDLDIFEDLSELNPGFVYKEIQKLDTDQKVYGWIPLMTSCSGGQIGALCAESFCERILSEANDVCHEGNTLLDTEEINMLVVLRMN